MAVKLKKILSQTSTLQPIMFGEDSLNIDVYLNVYTPRFEEESQRRRNSGVETEAGEALGIMVVPLIASWDLSDEYEVGHMIDEDVPMVNIGSDEEHIYETPKIDTWRFLYEDASTHKLVEDIREFISVRDDSRGICVIRRFRPAIKNGKPVTHEHIVPITITGLSGIPMNIMTEILRKAGDAMTPGETKSSSSEESSFTDA